MPRWTVPVVGALTVALLVAGLTAVVVERRGDDDPRVAARSSSATSRPPATTSSTTTTPATTAPPTTTTTAALPAGLQAALGPLQAFVERERGLRFKHPLNVELLADAPFEQRLLDADADDIEELRDTGSVLQALGLLDRGIDLVATVKRYTAGAVVGFYDPETKQLVLRGQDPNPYLNIVLVHELTHALEDQQFDLNREELGDEALFGFQALAEGSALRIEDRYTASLSVAERRAAQNARRARAGSIPRDVPDVVEIAFGFPYAYGPAVVRAVVRAGGQARLDAAFAQPPASTEQVLDPAKYLGGDAPRLVPTPASEGSAFDDGEVGEMYLRLMLDVELEATDAVRAARGWGGDHYVAWRDGDRTCVRMDFVMDTPEDTAELADALGRWAGRREGRATADGTSLRTCG